MCLQLHFLLKVCPSPFCLKIPTSFPCFLSRFLSSGRFMIPSPSLFPTAFCSNSNERVYCREGLWTCDAWSCCSALCVWSFSFLSLSLSSFQRRWQLLMLLSCSGRLWIVLYIAIRKSRDQMREREQILREGDEWMRFDCNSRGFKTARIRLPWYQFWDIHFVLWGIRVCVRSQHLMQGLTRDVMKTMRHPRVNERRFVFRTSSSVSHRFLFYSFATRFIPISSFCPFFSHFPLLMWQSHLWMKGQFLQMIFLCLDIQTNE